MISAKSIFAIGVLLLIGGLAYAGVELAQSVKPIELWVYHGPLGGIVSILGGGFILLSFDPQILDRLPFMKKDPPSPPSPPNQIPPPGV